MSESDSFIEEVTEEVRRDKLFKLFKKYGWLLVLAVVAIVGGTAYNEWDKSQRLTEARLTGDLMRAAVAAEDADALAVLAGDEVSSALITRIEQANILVAKDEPEAALAVLRSVADDPVALPIYGDLALLKIVMLEAANMGADDRRDAFNRLTAPGAPYRLLAQEQLAMQYVRDGDTEAAITELRAILVDSGVTPNLRNRAQQLIVALGGSVELDTANG